MNQLLQQIGLAYIVWDKYTIYLVTQKSKFNELWSINLND